MTSNTMQCKAGIIKLLLILGGVTFAQARCWGLVCLGEHIVYYLYHLGGSFIADGDYQKAERPDYRVDVLVSPLLNEVFKVNYLTCHSRRFGPPHPGVR